VLIIGSTFLMATWHTRVGSILVLIACGWLTWQIGPDCISGIIQPRQPLEAPKPYIFLAALLLFVLLADVAAIFAFRGIRKTI
jgi:NADH:ubiquinone oxidoreductase subunit 5 (subunit L)/multisubunit Na+/H+ antiporter MnhA subunit